MSGCRCCTSAPSVIADETKYVCHASSSSLSALQQQQAEQLVDERRWDEGLWGLPVCRPLQARLRNLRKSSAPCACDVRRRLSEGFLPSAVAVPQGVCSGLEVSRVFSHTDTGRDLGTSQHALKGVGYNGIEQHLPRIIDTKNVFTSLTKTK